MKYKNLVYSLLVGGIFLFAYGSVNAQAVEAVKKAADSTKKATVKTAKVAGSATKKGAKKAKDGTVKVSKKAASKTKEVVTKTPAVVENVADGTTSVVKKGAKAGYKGGRYLVVTSWDGTKWVSKKVWFAGKKSFPKKKEKVMP